MTRLRIIPIVLLALAPGGMVRAQGGAVGSPALSGYTSGWSLDRRPIVPVSAYSASPYYPGSYGSLASPIFMTTLSYPGIYGAYSYGNGGITLSREPWFTAVVSDRYDIPAISITTAPLRDASTPAGAPTLYAVPPPLNPVVPGSVALRTIPPDQMFVVPAAPAEQTARVVVRVPEDARLEFEGVMVPQEGRLRKFVTPALVPGKKYLYDVRATWQEEGRPVVRERRIAVYAGEKTDIDFLRPGEENSGRELRVRPNVPAP
jgi:uncharacterized protein (TIGR03000 family)